MNYYNYKAKGADGSVVKGTLAANDEIELHSKLKQEGVYLVSAKLIKKEKHRKRLKAKTISEFSRNIEKLVGAGVTIVKALRVVAEDESIKASEREVFVDVLKQVRTGMSFSEALAEQGNAFPPLFINMIKSSETSGNLEKVARQMAIYYDKENRLSSKIKSSMTYPKILMVLIVVVVAIILGYVLPQFDVLFKQMKELPISTQILMGISGFVKKRWYILILVLILGYIGIQIVFSFEIVKYYKDKLFIKLPMVSGLLKIIYTARFARTLSSLYSAGIPIIQCVQVARTTIGNKYIEKQFDIVISDVLAGENLSDAIAKVDGFTRKIVATIKVSEETGTLDVMLNSIAEQLEFDSEMALNKLVTYLEPVMIVVMAVIVGFIIISVIQPIYGSYQSISNM